MASVFEIAAKARLQATIGGQINQYVRSAASRVVAGAIGALSGSSGGGVSTTYYAGGTTLTGIAPPLDPQTTAPAPTQAQIDAFLTRRRGDGPGGLPESAFMGGYTPLEARDLLTRFRENRPAMKSLFMVDIAGPSTAITAQEMGLSSEPESNGLSAEDAFSFFATDVSYGPITLEGEKKKIGSAQADTVDTGGPTDLTITVMDDERGTLKRWFRALSARTVASDGTVGVPADFAVSIEITHAIASQQAAGFALAYSDTVLVRPKSVEFELGRSARGEVQTFQMGFTQLDTFLSVLPVNPR
jgi:hypothetical protein